MATKTATRPARTRTPDPTTRNGRVAAEIRKLLTGRKNPLDYRTIAERVRAKVPGARTTDRSVASVASTLRKEGEDLPDRRARAT